MPAHYDVVIVGAGHAGAQAAIALRKEGFDGSIAMIGSEDAFPYERPPLSKEYLVGDKPFDRMLLRPERFWTEKQVTLILGQEVTQLRANAKQVILSSADIIGYGALIWAAGGDARRLNCSGADLGGIHCLRSKNDADQITDYLNEDVRKICVIGGGYIGLESAAALRKIGKDVVVIEDQDRVLSRVAGQHISKFYQDYHLGNGVEFRLKTQARGFVGHEGKVSGLEIASTESDSSELIDCDMVIVGIGIVPAIRPLAEAGAQCANGIHVDEFCQTSLPGIFAIGDCAQHANKFAGGAAIRLESVQNANDMANTAAKAICGSAQPYEACPWFWSNQYDLKLQTIGLSRGFDGEVLRGDPQSGSFSVIYLKSGKVIALDCVNAVKDYVQGKKLVENGVALSRDKLEDCSRSLKEWLVA